MPTAVGTHQAMTAPSMKNSPCATFTTRMTLKTSDTERGHRQDEREDRSFQNCQEEVGAAGHGGIDPSGSVDARRPAARAAADPAVRERRRYYRTSARARARTRTVDSRPRGAAS